MNSFVLSFSGNRIFAVSITITKNIRNTRKIISQYYKGVAVVLRNDVVKRLTKVECCCDRLMFVKTSAKPVDIV